MAAPLVVRGSGWTTSDVGRGRTAGKRGAAAAAAARGGGASGGGRDAPASIMDMLAAKCCEISSICGAWGWWCVGAA